MAVEEVKPGDVVLLRVTGSPELVVREIKDGIADCDWFRTEDGSFYESRFPLTSLRLLRRTGQ